jgi:hypothetical protein
LYVRGTFKNPQAGVKPGPLIARGAVAAALATLVTPAAALLALISPSEGEANQCRAILADDEIRDCTPVSHQKLRRTRDIPFPVAQIDRIRYAAFAGMIRCRGGSPDKALTPHPGKT